MITANEHKLALDTKTETIEYNSDKDKQLEKSKDPEALGQFLISTYSNIGLSPIVTYGRSLFS